MAEEKKENNKKSVKNKSNDECIKNFKLAKDFFKGKLTIKEKDDIFAHLFKCQSCLKSYKFYLRAIRNEDFNLTKEAIDFCNSNLENDKLKTRKILKKLKTTGLYTLDNKYECIAKEFRLSKLKDVEAVSQLFLGDETIDSIKDQELLLEFAKHLCYNICKDIDLLERCYRKGMGVLVEDSIPEEEILTNETK